MEGLWVGNDAGVMAGVVVAMDEGERWSSEWVMWGGRGRRSEGSGGRPRWCRSCHHALQWHTPLYCVIETVTCVCFKLFHAAVCTSDLLRFVLRPLVFASPLSLDTSVEIV